MVGKKINWNFMSKRLCRVQSEEEQCPVSTQSRTTAPLLKWK